jgi:hypothetical protein
MTNMLDNNKTGGPAFPIADPFIAMNPQTVEEAKRLQGGMTLRDYFAAKAMSSMLSQAPDDWHEDINDLAIASYEVADAMLEARKV